MNFMHFELSEHDFWLSRDAVYEHFQDNVQQTFPSKHVILDATEVPYVGQHIVMPKEWRFRRTGTRTI